jgi:hypothetical protein
MRHASQIKSSVVGWHRVPTLASRPIDNPPVAREKVQRRYDR